MIAISDEHQPDSIGSASDGVWQGGAAALLHQGCPVAVHDCQVIVGTGGIGLDVERIKLQGDDQSLLNLYSVCPLKVEWIVVGVVWRCDNTCDKKKTVCHFPFHHSPSLPQPSVGQSINSIGCQSLSPVVGSRTQTRLSQGESEHWPQQQSSPLK